MGAGFAAEQISSPRGNKPKAKKVLEPMGQDMEQAMGLDTQQQLASPVGNTTRDSHVLEQTGPATEQRIASPSKNNKEAKEFLEPTGPATEQLVASSSKKKKKGQTVLVTIVPDMEQPSASPGENITEHHRMTLMTGISLITEAATEQPFASM